MAIPTQAQLYEEVDRRFAIEQPDAPRRLDPDDPNQAAWVARWLELRDEVLNDWTNFVFNEYFPDRGTLDASDPDAEYWRDIQHQIGTGESGRWSWDQPPVPPLRVLSVVRDNPGGGYVLVFSDTVSADTAGSYLWPNGVPAGATIEVRGSMAIHLLLDIEALRTMRDDVAAEISEEGILRAD